MMHLKSRAVLPVLVVSTCFAGLTGLGCSQRRDHAAQVETRLDGFETRYEGACTQDKTTPIGVYQRGLTVAVLIGDPTNTAGDRWAMTTLHGREAVLELADALDPRPSTHIFRAAPGELRISGGGVEGWTRFTILNGRGNTAKVGASVLNEDVATVGKRLRTSLAR